MPVCHAEREMRFGEKFWQSGPDHIEDVIRLATGDADYARRVSNEIEVQQVVEKATRG